MLLKTGEIYYQVANRPRRPRYYWVRADPPGIYDPILSGMMRKWVVETFGEDQHYTKWWAVPDNTYFFADAKARTAFILRWA